MRNTQKINSFANVSWIIMAWTKLSDKKKEKNTLFLAEHESLLDRLSGETSGMYFL